MKDEKMLAKLVVRAKNDPKFAEELKKQAEVISDDELEAVSGGDACVFVSCVFTSACMFDSDATDDNKRTSNQQVL